VSCLHRVRRTNFTVVPNELLSDPDLDGVAKWIVAYMLSKPDDWNFSAARIVRETREGIDAVRGAMSRAEAAGWLRRTVVHDERGRLSYDHWVRDDLSLSWPDNPTISTGGSLDSPSLDKPSSGRPSSGRPSTVKPTPKKERDSKTDSVRLREKDTTLASLAADPAESAETTSPSVRNPAAKKPRKRREPKPSPNGTLAEKFPALFAEFWSAYPRKIGKPPATAAFQKALMRTGTAAPIMAGLARHAARWAEIDEAQFVPHPATWLNRDGWDDDLAPLPKRKRSSHDDDMAVLAAMFDSPAAPRQRAANGSNGSKALTTTAREIPAVTGRSRGQSGQLPEGLTTL
jgi:hypothetical protein